MNDSNIHRVIFLPHPYEEHSVEDKKSIKGIKEWNTKKKHFRKFMCATGNYIEVSREGTDIFHEDKEIYFWGEWESESTWEKYSDESKSESSSAEYSDELKSESIYAGYSDKSKDEMPRYVHVPKCYKNSIFGKLSNAQEVDENECNEFYSKKQNTDPYVFGNRFMYSCCKQGGKNPLKELNRGDIIVFYGQKGKRKTNNYTCYIDTVFVVGGVIEKGKYKDILKRLISKKKEKRMVSDQFIFKTILPIIYGNNGSLGKDSESEYVLYYGATYEEQVNGMFSYFPCNASMNNKAFSRFKCGPFYGHKVGKNNINKKCHYPDNNVSVNTYKTEAEVKEFWETLKCNILKAGYKLGIKANEPIPEDCES